VTLKTFYPSVVSAPFFGVLIPVGIG